MTKAGQEGAATNGRAVFAVRFELGQKPPKVSPIARLSLKKPARRNWRVFLVVDAAVIAHNQARWGAPMRSVGTGLEKR